MRCEVAEDSVVVMKSRPVKAGNRLEDKTGTIRRLVGGGRNAPKAVSGMRRDDVYSKVFGNCNFTSRRTQAARRGGTRYRR
jgi:hypothetical protein